VNLPQLMIARQRRANPKQIGNIGRRVNNRPDER
jgi:hypothetical protein